MQHVRDDAPDGRTVDDEVRLSPERRRVLEADQMVNNIDVGDATKAVSENDCPFARADDHAGAIDDGQRLILDHADSRIVVRLPKVSSHPIVLKARHARDCRVLACIPQVACRLR